LSQAAGTGNLSLIDTLIENGVEIDGVDPEDGDNETSLMRAAATDQHLVIRKLLENGADRFRKDADGRTALMIAACFDRLNALEELLKPEKSNEIAALEPGNRYEDLRDGMGRTALLWAAYMGKTRTTEALIKRGVDLEIADDWGRTPLMWAATSKGAEGYNAAAVLLEAGADPLAEDKSGATALTWAMEAGRKDIMELIAKFQFGADAEFIDQEPK